MSKEPVVVAILQARMRSTRRPGKVLAPILGEPMLAHVVRRGAAARCLDAFVVATSDRAADDPVAALAGELGVGVFRGSELDVLGRYCGAARTFGADVVVRLTADDPFVDGPFVDDAVGAFLESDPPCDYLDTTASETYPVGMAVQVFTAAALDEAGAEAVEPHCR
ncbi:MAG: cytidylyltransferase domain-containing protein [Planctomycetota bacterium]|jgi:spore coat polysaccharide biosynthesis protein SpsF (cytidylyltransferase family)